MSITVGKILGKVALVLAGSIAIGYAEYRLQGGVPITKLYNQVQNERLMAEAIAKAKANGTCIKAEGSVE